MILASSHTYDVERVLRILEENTFVEGPSNDQKIPSPLRCRNFGHAFENGKTHYFYSEGEQKARIGAVCANLYHETCDPASHLDGLDRIYSELVECGFRPIESPQKIVKETSSILSRLPAHSLELVDVPIDLARGFLVLDTAATQWGNLQVATYLSTNVIRAALLAIVHSGIGMFAPLIDMTANILDVVSQLSSSAISEESKRRWFIVRAFLWTSWQRLTMIYFSGILGRYLRFGFNDQDGASRILRGTHPSPGLSVQEMSGRYASSMKPTYMCGWAFELLRKDPVCINSDFRTFHQRYAKVFGSFPGRCLLAVQNSCRGDHPDHCQRFKGLKIDDQSAHDQICAGNCKKLIWDETLYRSLSGSRAVPIVKGTPQGHRLPYCHTSNRTMAISHVWSHGQGGRPETGFNNCLHERYSALADSLGCDSYWMDTPCIPDDPQLRKESIRNINKVFAQSKAVLLCDRDVMEVDTQGSSIEVMELLLVTLLVSDWSVRAWTFLEAFRGRNSIYLLCKHNALFSVKEAVETVYRYGSLEIGNLLLTTPQILPPDTPVGFPQPKFEEPNAVTDVNGYLSIETSASLLSHRAFTKPGDDIIIWSLLLADKVFSDPEDFWRSRREGLVSIGFLLSSAPRLKARGLTWAPSSPTAGLLADSSSPTSSRFLVFDAGDSDYGRITADGLRATWLLYHFPGTGAGAKANSIIKSLASADSNETCDWNLECIRRKFLKGYRWGALLRPIKSNTYDRPLAYRGDASKTLAAVCATNDGVNTWDKTKKNKIFWIWRGVYEWDPREPLPRFRTHEEVWIA